MVTNCQQCGKFTTNEKYCNRECFYESQKNRVTLVCERCEGEFELPKSDVEHGRGRYCSMECRRGARMVEQICEECGETFMAEKNYVEQSDGSATYCGQECYSRAQRLPKALRERSNYGSLWRDRRWEALARDNFECQKCGMKMSECRDEHDTGLHVHHVVPYREFDSDEEAHRLDNLQTLCPSCHVEEE